MPRFSSSRTRVACVNRFGAFVRFAARATSTTRSDAPSSRSGTETSSRSGGQTGSKPGEHHHDPGERETPRAGDRLYSVRPYPGRRQLALRRAPRDQLLEPRRVALDRRPATGIEGGRPNRLVGFLGAAGGLEAVRRIGDVLVPVDLGDLLRSAVAASADTLTESLRM